MGCRERRIYWLQGKWNEKVNRLQGEIGSEEERKFFGSKGKSKKEKDSPAAEEDQEKWFTTCFKASEFFWKETFHLFQGRRRNDLAIYTEEVDFLVVHRSKTYGFFRFKTNKTRTKRWLRDSSEEQNSPTTGEENIIHRFQGRGFICSRKERSLLGYNKTNKES
jgi:hypothetical protein